MLSKQEAADLAVQRVQEIAGSFEGRLTIVDEHTIDKPYGWIFCIQSTDYVQSHDSRQMIFGLGPVVVNKFDATALILPSNLPPELAIAEHETELGLDNA